MPVAISTPPSSPTGMTIKTVFSHCQRAPRCWGWKEENKVAPVENYWAREWKGTEKAWNGCVGWKRKLTKQTQEAGQAMYELPGYEWVLVDSICHIVLFYESLTARVQALKNWIFVFLQNWGFAREMWQENTGTNGLGYRQSIYWIMNHRI